MMAMCQYFTARDGIHEEAMNDQHKPKLAYPIEEAFALIGVSRTRGYQLINSGTLKSFKDGKRRLVTHKALEQCVEAMQRASEGRKAA